MLLTLYLLTSFVYFRLCGLLLIEEDDITNNDDVNKHADIAAASFGQNCCGSVSLGKRSRFKFHKEYLFLKISKYFRPCRTAVYVSMCCEHPTTTEYSV